MSSAVVEYSLCRFPLSVCVCVCVCVCVYVCVNKKTSGPVKAIFHED